MSIYPERTKSGEPTGVWVIEVQVGSKRTRRRTRDFSKARVIEASLLGNPNPLVPCVGTSATPEYTIGNLTVDVARLYDRTKDRRQSIQRLESVMSILGAHKPVSGIRTPDLDAVAKVLMDRGLSPKSVNRYLATASKALRWAVDREYLQRMPKVPKLPESPGRRGYLSEADERAFLGLLGPDVALVARVLLVSGFRVSELLGLSLSDITADGWLRLHDGETKNGSGRSAFIGEALGEALLALKRRGLPSYRQVLSGLQSASAARGIDPPITPHVLRHTAGSRLNARGVPTATVAELLGHRDMRTTRGYIHVQSEELKEAAKLLLEEPK